MLDAVLENALRVCDAKFGVLYRYVGDGRFHAAAWRNVSPAYEEVLRQRGSYRPKVGTVNDCLLKTGQLVHVADASSEPVDAATVYGGARSLIAVPMLKEGELVGSFVIYRTEVRSFTEKQIELVTPLRTRDCSENCARALMSWCAWSRSCVRSATSSRQ